MLGKRIPRSNLTVLPALIWETVVQIFHTYFPRSFVGRKSLEGSEEELLAVRLYSRLAYAYWFYRGMPVTMWAHLRELNVSELYPLPRSKPRPTRITPSQ